MSLISRIEQERTAKKVKKGSFVSRSQVKISPDKVIKERIREKMVAQIPRELLAIGGDDDSILRSEVERIVEQVFSETPIPPFSVDKPKMLIEVMNEVVGFGPITPLLLDDGVSEVMVNGPKQVYVEKRGRIELSDVTFRDNEHVMQVIERVVAPIGRRIDESSPMVDARLPDGSRVNAIIPPLSLKGPCLTIRKFAREPLTVEDLIKYETMSPEMAAVLEACVRIKLNIVVSGGTGSGKTTTLNVLSSFIPHNERIITIEDSAELQLRQEHVVTLETRLPNIEGRGAVSMRDLVRNSLRMRPDRIVVGEVRGGEALDMLQAMNTGHDGSLTTGHANSPRDMLSRLETMVLMAGMELPIKAIREQLASALNLIVHQSRMKDGSRKITHITEVLGMVGDTITLQDIFLYEQTTIDSDGRIVGRFHPTGIRPVFANRVEAAGVMLPADLFADDPGRTH